MSEYMRGRADERASIVAWLETEAATEPLQSYSNAYRLAAVSLRNIAATSEMVGQNGHIGVAPIQESALQARWTE